MRKLDRPLHHEKALTIGRRIVGDSHGRKVGCKVWSLEQHLRLAGGKGGAGGHVHHHQLVPAAAEPLSSVSAPDRLSGPRRVLVVEDQTDVRDSLRLVLEDAGYQVFEATDGPGAIEAVERYEPAAAIIDIGLPGFDGYEVAKRVRRMSHGPAMLLVALTGYGPQTRHRAHEAGFNLHLIKPVNAAQLHELLRTSRRN